MGLLRKFIELGSRVEAFDISRNFFVKDIECKKADVNQGIPVPDDWRIVICREESTFQRPGKSFSEFNRILGKFYHNPKLFIHFSKTQLYASSPRPQ